MSTREVYRAHAARNRDRVAYVFVQQRRRTGRAAEKFAAEKATRGQGDGGDGAPAEANEEPSKQDFRVRALDLRRQAEQARRLATSFPIDGDKELLLRQAHELEETASSFEAKAAQ